MQEKIVLAVDWKILLEAIYLFILQVLDIMKCIK
jgi:hypothetical protein